MNRTESEELAALRAENQKLREALEQYAMIPTAHGEIARIALANKGE